VKAAALAILALGLGGCSDRALTRQQMASIAQVDVIVTAAPEIPFVRQPPADQPAKRPPLDTSKDAGTVISQAVSNALADASAAQADQQQRLKMVSAASSFLREAGTYDVASEMFMATRQALAKVTLTRATAMPPPLSTLADAERRAAYDRSSASAVLFFTIEYAFVEIYGIHYMVQFNAVAAMFPKTDGLKQLRRRPDDGDPLADDNAIYRKQFESLIRYRGGDAVAIFKQAADGFAARLANDLNGAR
jgi:hypothetical protein